MRRDGIAAALNALSNVSRDLVSEADLRRILSTGDGPGHLVRALFEDCSIETLDRLAASFGWSPETVRTAYRRARMLHAVKNADLDTLNQDYRSGGNLRPRVCEG